MSSKALPQPIKPLPNIGDPLRETFTIVRNNAGLLYGYAGWLLVPLVGQILLRITFGDTPLVDMLLGILSGSTLAIGVWVFVQIVRTAAHDDADHSSPNTDEHVLPMLFFTLLAFLLYAVIVTVGLLLIVPGIIFATWFVFAPLIVVLERRGIFIAFGESRAFVRGRFFRVLIRLLAVDGSFIAAYAALVLAGNLALGYDLMHIDPTAPLPVPMDILLGTAEILATPILVVYRTRLYLGLKNR